MLMLKQYPFRPRRWVSSESLFLYCGWFGIPLVFVSSTCLFFPLGSAYVFGADEPSELIKAFLWFMGHEMYTEIWNNMPPVHTWMVKEIFNLFGLNQLRKRSSGKKCFHRFSAHQGEVVELSSAVKIAKMICGVCNFLNQSLRKLRAL